MIAIPTETEDLAKVLTAREKALVEYYLQLNSITEAGIKAGYSAKSACWTAGKVLKKAHVKAYLDQLSKEVYRKLKRTPDGIREKIAEIAESTTKDETRLKALELLGRATPGTFEKAAPALEVNLFSILGDLVRNAPALTAPGAIDITSLPVDIPSAPIIEKAVDHATPADPTKIPTPQDEPGTPPPPGIDIDIDPQKISDQNPIIATGDVKGENGGDNPGEEGIAHE